MNRLNKTKVEKFPDLREEREARRGELRKRDQGALQAKVREFAYALSIVSSHYLMFCMLQSRMTLSKIVAPSICSTPTYSVSSS